MDETHSKQSGFNGTGHMTSDGVEGDSCEDKLALLSNDDDSDDWDFADWSTHFPIHVHDRFRQTHELFTSNILPSMLPLFKRPICL